jgi:hypothetical protein
MDKIVFSRTRSFCCSVLVYFFFVKSLGHKDIGGGGYVYIRLFLTTALVGDDWSASCPVHIAPDVNGLESVWRARREESYCLCQDWYLDTLAVLPLANCCTYCYQGCITSVFLKFIVEEKLQLSQALKSLLHHLCEPGHIFPLYRML